MEDKAGVAAGIGAALALIAYIGLSGGLVNFIFGSEPEAPTAEQLEYVVAHTQFAFPIPYDISVTQSGYGIREPRTHYQVGYRLEAK